MNINIIGKNIKVTEGIHNKICEQIGKCERFIDKDTKIKVLIRTVKDNQIIEVTIPLKKGRVIRAEKRSADLYEAIDLVQAALMTQLKRHKEKITTHRHGDIKNRSEAKRVLAMEYPIVKEKVCKLELISPAQAIDELENLNHDFHLFTNLDDGNVCVVYRREDFGYGMITGLH